VTEQTYTWHGKHGRGAMKARREQKRLQAEARNERTEPKRRSVKRLGRKTNEALTEQRRARRTRKKRS